MKVENSRNLQAFAAWLKQDFHKNENLQLESGQPRDQRDLLFFRQHHADFEVQEQLSFTPAGEGHHFLCWIEKQGLSTNHLVQRISERWKISRREMGFAGRKDQRGITRQWVSVPASGFGHEEPQDFQIEGTRILKVVRNTKKLRLGQLKHNRFKIFLRGRLNRQEEFEARWQGLLAEGLPNFFGHQRFGYGQANLDKVLQFLNRPKRARSTKEKFLVSVFQSICFNHWLKERLAQGLLPGAIEGDVMLGLPFGQRPFVVDALVETRARIQRGELTVAGPLPGPKAKAARTAAHDFEKACWQQMGLTEAWMGQHPSLAQGARRPAFVPLIEPSWSSATEGTLLKFSLPKGSYATVALDALLPGQIKDFAQGE